MECDNPATPSLGSPCHKPNCSFKSDFHNWLMEFTLNKFLNRDSRNIGNWWFERSQEVCHTMLESCLSETGMRVGKLYFLILSIARFNMDSCPGDTSSHHYLLWFELWPNKKWWNDKAHTTRLMSWIKTPLSAITILENNNPTLLLSLLVGGFVSICRR